MRDTDRWGPAREAEDERGVQGAVGLRSLHLPPRGCQPCARNRVPLKGGGREPGLSNAMSTMGSQSPRASPRSCSSGRGPPGWGPGARGRSRLLAARPVLLCDRHSRCCPSHTCPLGARAASRTEGRVAEAPWPRAPRAAGRAAWCHMWCHKGPAWSTRERHTHPRRSQTPV